MRQILEQLARRVGLHVPLCTHGLKLRGHSGDLGPMHLPLPPQLLELAPRPVKGVHEVMLPLRISLQPLDLQSSRFVFPLCLHTQATLLVERCLEPCNARLQPLDLGLVLKLLPTFFSQPAKIRAHEIAGRGRVFVLLLCLVSSADRRLTRRLQLQEPRVQPVALVLEAVALCQHVLVPAQRFGVQRPLRSAIRVRSSKFCLKVVAHRSRFLPPFALRL
mmetsp:Transcript_85209/g.237888  ORF Transcript_85209/g.237888 Transcript_85209/m.237888 type:complete len:219 (-) Transcript_85209:1242-1898(-)